MKVEVSFFIGGSIHKEIVIVDRFEDAEKVKYTSNVSAVGGLTNNAEYFVDKIDDNNFRLCEVRDAGVTVRT